MSLYTEVGSNAVLTFAALIETSRATLSQPIGNVRSREWNAPLGSAGLSLIEAVPEISTNIGKETSHMCVEGRSPRKRSGALGRPQEGGSAREAGDRQSE